MRMFENMKKIVTILFVIAALPGSLFARFQESAVQCDKRYGKPVSIKIVGAEQLRWYEMQGYIVEAVFSKGVAVEIFYSRKDHMGLSNAELNALMRFNISESKWLRLNQVELWKNDNKDQQLSEEQQLKLMRDLSTFVMWRRADDKAEASYDRESGVLFIGERTRLEEARKTALRERAVPESLKGF
ncbi:MAG: hypothetical protein ACI9OU_000245 [Candidatus Promineifilaceae bacterium]|jgi:hypothetical protein